MMEVSALGALAMAAKQASGRRDLAVEMARMQIKAQQSVVDMIVKSSEALQQGRGGSVDVIA